MNSCKECGSYAINPHCHGREEGVDLDLCDVCYWRKRAAAKAVEPFAWLFADRSWTNIRAMGMDHNGIPVYTSPQPTWRSMDSAPKDGAAVLLTNGNGVWIGKYKPVYLSGLVPKTPWFTLMHNHDYMSNKVTNPTAWMPLPEAPKE